MNKEEGFLTFNHKSLKALFDLYPSLKFRHAKQKCKYPNKEFKIMGYSHSKMSVYYEDNRTNNKCKCYFCSSSYSDYRRKLKCIQVEYVNIVSKQQLERKKKLDNLLK